MAFPSLRAVVESVEGAATTTHDVDLTGIAAGDLAVVLIGLSEDVLDVPSPLGNFPSGWAELFHQFISVVPLAGVQAAWAKVDCDGTESSFQFTTPVSCTSLSTVLLVERAHRTTAPQTVFSTATGVNPKPPAFGQSLNTYPEQEYLFVNFWHEIIVSSVVAWGETDNQNSNDNGVESYALAKVEDGPVRSMGTWTISDAGSFGDSGLKIRPRGDDVRRFKQYRRKPQRRPARAPEISYKRPPIIEQIDLPATGAELIVRYPHPGILAR